MSRVAIALAPFAKETGFLALPLVLAWARFCQALNGRGVHTTAVLIEAATFNPDPGRAPSTLLLVSSLAAAHIDTYLVKRGDRLDHALSSPRAAMWTRP